MIHLNRNEQRTAAISAVVLAIWALYGFVVKPAISRTATLQRVIPQKQEEMASLRKQVSDYKVLHSVGAGLQERIARQDPTFELLPYLDAMLQQRELQESSSMQQQIIPLDAAYAETVVEILLDGITLEQIVDLLQSLEASEALLQARSLHITHDSTDAGRLDCVLAIHNPKMLPQPGLPQP